MIYVLMALFVVDFTLILCSFFYPWCFDIILEEHFIFGCWCSLLVCFSLSLVHFNSAEGRCISCVGAL